MGPLRWRRTAGRKAKGVRSGAHTRCSIGMDCAGRVANVTIGMSGEGRLLIGSPLPLPLLLSLPPHLYRPDFRMDMAVTLEDLYNGQQRTINVKRKVICKACVERQRGRTRCGQPGVRAGARGFRLLLRALIQVFFVSMRSSFFNSTAAVARVAAPRADRPPLALTVSTTHAQAVAAAVKAKSCPRTPRYVSAAH